MSITPNKNMEDTSLKAHDMTRSLFIVLGGVAVVIALIYGYPHMMALFGKQQQVVVTIEQLEQRNLSLEQKVATLTSRLEDSLTQLQTKVSSLEQAQKVAANSQVASSNSSSQDHENLKARVDSLEKLLATRQQQIAKVPETIGLFERLRDAFAGSKPFVEQVKQTQVLFDPNDIVIQERLKTLESYGAAGVPTVEQLGSEFKDVARELRLLSIPEDLPWYSKFVQRLRSMVVVRHTGEELGADATPDERVLGIQDLLDGGNLEGALVQANLLPTYDCQAFKEWRDAADKRLLIEQSVPILEAHALAYLLAGGDRERN